MLDRSFLFCLLLAASLNIACDRAIVEDIDSVTLQKRILTDEVARYVKIDSRTFAVVGATIIDGSGSAPRRNQTILVSDSIITAIGHQDSVNIPESYLIIDATGHSVIPGFIGMHNHTHRPGSTFEPYVTTRLSLAGGVTTIQTTGSADPMRELALSDSIRTSAIPGPRIFPTSPYVTGPGGNVPPMTAPTSDEAAREFVRLWADRGVTWIKLYRHVRLDIARAIIDEAHLQGLKVTGHLCSLTFSEAASIGIDSIEHGLLSLSDFVNDKPAGECVSNMSSISDLDISGDAVSDLIRRLVENHVTLTSTLAISESHFPSRPQGDTRSLSMLSPSALAQYSERQKRLTLNSESTRYTPVLFAKIMEFERRFVSAGGHLVAGPDTGRHIVPGFGDQRNFELLVEAGFSVPHAIEIMTSNGAQQLGIADSVGFIRTGFLADFQIIGADLSVDPSAIRKLLTVFKDGVGFDPQLLVQDSEGKVGLGL